MAYIPDIEKLPLHTQHEMQFQKLKDLIAYLNKHSTYYIRKNLGQYALHSLKDIALLPTTTKEELQTNIQDFYCVATEQIAEYTATSGTLGKALRVPLTKKDIDRLAYNEYLTFEAMQVDAHDVVQLMLTLDRQFMAGSAYYLGAQKNGAAVIRSGPGLASMQLETIQSLKTSVLVAVPSFIMALIAEAEKIKIDLNELSVKKILCIGEAIRDEHFQLNTLGRAITEKWKVSLFSTYASTEMQTAFTDCIHGKGGHAHPELILTEIIDEDGKPLGAGEYGEVCISTFGIEAMPLLRYRTGDIACYYDEPCTCGHNTIRLSPVIGRKKQMIKYKGTTLYPQAIFNVLNECTDVKAYTIEVKTDSLNNDELILHLQTNLSKERCADIVKPLLQSQLRIVPILNFVNEAEMQQMQFPNGNRKAITFIDNRKSINS